MNVFVYIRKVIDGKDPIDNKPATESRVEIDTIPLDDLVSFRAWYKKDKDKSIDGEFTLLTMISRGKDGGMYTIKINEPESEFKDRIAPYRKAVDLV